MSFQIESTVACLPITALYVIQHDQSIWLIIGQGPNLGLYDVKTSEHLSTIKIFSKQTIHGLTSRLRASQADGFGKFELLIWGGKQVRFARLTVSSDSESQSTNDLSITLSECAEASDWILKAVFLQNPISSTARVILLTAKNHVYHLKNSEANFKRDGSVCLGVLAYGPKSFLYAGDVIEAKPGTLIIASGTAFGAILVWICTWNTTALRWSTMLQRVFMAHKGSIFGICISKVTNISLDSNRWLASCSDDRTIRVWNITDCENLSSSISPPVESASTGFDTGDYTETQPYAMVWAHISRIWNVQFIGNVPSNQDRDQLLLSVGEDATCQLWHFNHRHSLQPISAENTMDLISYDKYHVGKNVWSMTNCIIDDDVFIFTGGADGRIVPRSQSLISYCQKNYGSVDMRFRDIPVSLEAFKQYHILSQNSVLAITDRGELLQGHIEDCVHVDWHASPLGHSSSEVSLCRNTHSQNAYVVDTSGTMNILMPGHNATFQISLLAKFQTLNVFVAYERSNIASTIFEACLVSVASNNSEVVLTWVNLEGENLVTEKRSVVLPSTFIITSAAYDKINKTLILGSRAGALTVYSGVHFGSDVPINSRCYRHVHGSDAVTSISLLPEPNDIHENTGCENLHILTTGRDGMIGVHRIHTRLEATIESSLKTVHLSAPTLGRHIEGAYLVQNRTGTQSIDVLIYGFRAKEFIIWHEALDTSIFEIDCGGAHRSWDYKPGTDNTATFAWTKTGSFNLVTKKVRRHDILQQGGHGREIKALAQSPILFNDLRAASTPYHLIATGAEDTCIRLFASPCSNDTTDETQGFQCVATLRRHTTGVQDLVFSDCGTYLFSSAGCEELFVWRLWFGVPCFRIGVVLQDAMHKQEHDRDARITNLDIKSQNLTFDQSSQLANFTIISAYSNGKAKVMVYRPGEALRSGHFEILHEIIFGSFCLTQVAPLENIHTRSLNILSAGTNGYLNLHCHTNHDSTISKTMQRIDVHRIHQSTVMIMTTLQLEDNLWLIATGGDDNAIGLTFMQISSNYSSYRTLLVPKAHAAALTALDVVNISRSELETQVDIVTGGNDQKVKLWRVRFPVNPSVSLDEAQLKLPDLADVDVKRLADSWTAVADVSNIRNLNKENVLGKVKIKLDYRILVVGVGMEILLFNIDRDI